MVAPQQLGLTRVFADFSLLPYLLRYLPPVPRYQNTRNTTSVVWVN